MKKNKNIIYATCHCGSSITPTVRIHCSFVSLLSTCPTVRSILWSLTLLLFCSERSSLRFIVGDYVCRSSSTLFVRHFTDPGLKYLLFQMFALLSLTLNAFILVTPLILLVHFGPYLQEFLELIESFLAHMISIQWVAFCLTWKSILYCWACFQLLKWTLQVFNWQMAFSEPHRPHSQQKILLQWQFTGLGSYRCKILP